MAEATLNDVSTKLSSQLKVDEVIARGVNGLRDEFKKLYGIQEKLLRELAEQKREGGTSGGGGGEGASPKEAEKGINPFLAAAYVAVIAMVTAVKDYFQNIRKVLKTLFKPIRAAIRGLGQLFRAIFKEAGITKVINSVATTVKGAFSRLGRALKTLLPDPEAIQDSFRALKGYFIKLKSFFTSGADDFLKFLTDNSIFRVLKNGFNAIKNFLFGAFQGDEIKTIKSFFGNIGARISGFFDPIRKFFSFGEDSPLGKMVARLKSFFSFAQEGSTFARTLGSVGRVIGRLAWPITVIMAIIDSVTGAFKGFVNTDGSIAEKLLMGVLGGISGLVEGLIGMPLDLLKSLISTIAGFFGFEEAEKMLDSFKFTDLIRDMIMSPFVMIKRGINAVLEAIAVGVDSIPFPGTGKVASAIRDFKFEDTGESRTEMVARKKNEDAEADAALDAYDAESGLGKKKYKSEKFAKKVAKPGEEVVQDSEGNFRIKKKSSGPQEIKSGQLSGKAGKFVDDDLQPAYSGGAMPSMTVIGGDTNVGGSGTVLAGETRPSSGNDRALGTGFYRSTPGY